MLTQDLKALSSSQRKTLFASISILNLSEVFSILSLVENRTDGKNPQVSEQMGRTINFSFRHNSARPLQERLLIWRLPISPFSTFQKCWITCSVKEIEGTSVALTKLSPVSFFFLIVFAQHIVWFWLLTSDCYSLQYLFTVPGFTRSQKIFIWSTEDPGETHWRVRPGARQQYGVMC